VIVLPILKFAESASGRAGAKCATRGGSRVAARFNEQLSFRRMRPGRLTRYSNCAVSHPDAWKTLWESRRL